MSAVRICHDLDRECGMQQSWCATCPNRATLPAAPAPTCQSCNDSKVFGTPGVECPFCMAYKPAKLDQDWDAPAPTEQSSHETIVREGNMLTCTACGTSKKMADPCALPAEQAGELPPLPERDGDWAGDDWYTTATLQDYARAALAARQADPSAAAIRITNKQQADPKLAGPGATARERFLLAQLGWLQSAVLAARPAPTEAPKELTPDDALRNAQFAVSKAAPSEFPSVEIMMTPYDLVRFAGLVAARQAPDSRDAWPEEPTPEMQAAGAQAIRFDTTTINKMWTANAVYRAMRAAQEKAQ